MTHDQVLIVLIAAAWAGGVGLVGLGVGWLLRRRSAALARRWASRSSPSRPWWPALVGDRPGDVPVARTTSAWCCSVAVVAGIVALVFALLVGAGRRRAGRASLQEEARAVRRERARSIAQRDRARPSSRRSRPSCDGPAQTLAESRDRELRLEQSRRELVVVGLPRPADAAGRAAGDDRGARGRARRRPGALPRADAGRGRPDGADGRRPLRAVPDPRRRAAAQPRSRSRSATWSARRSPAPTRSPAPAAYGSDGRVDEDVLVTADPAGLSRVVSQPADERDPAHPGRRCRRGPRPGASPTASSSP